MGFTAVLRQHQWVLLQYSTASTPACFTTVQYCVYTSVFYYSTVHSSTPACFTLQSLSLALIQSSHRRLQIQRAKWGGLSALPRMHRVQVDGESPSTTSLPCHSNGGHNNGKVSASPWLMKWMSSSFQCQSYPVSFVSITYSLYVIIVFWRLKH